MTDYSAIFNGVKTVVTVEPSAREAFMQAVENKKTAREFLLEMPHKSTALLQDLQRAGDEEAVVRALSVSRVGKKLAKRGQAAPLADIVLGIQNIDSRAEIFSRNDFEFGRALAENERAAPAVAAIVKDLPSAEDRLKAILELGCVLVKNGVGREVIDIVANLPSSAQRTEAMLDSNSRLSVALAYDGGYSKKLLNIIRGLDTAEEKADALAALADLFMNHKIRLLHTIGSLETDEQKVRVLTSNSCTMGRSLHMLCEPRAAAMYMEVVKGIGASAQRTRVLRAGAGIIRYLAQTPAHEDTLLDIISNLDTLKEREEIVQIRALLGAESLVEAFDKRASGPAKFKQFMKGKLSGEIMEKILDSFEHQRTRPFWGGPG